MTDDIRMEIPKLQGHTCFACGTENPIGLNLRFYRLGEAVCADITLGKNYEGWENMAHGGILSTLLDEVMSWTILYFKRIFFVTRKMEVKYIKPALIGVPLQVRGELVKGGREGLIAVRAEIRDKNKILCKARGEFVELPLEKLSAVPDGLKRDMEELFRRFGSPV
jgi:uncharacterized protein (TIGR00369 family)